MSLTVRSRREGNSASKSGKNRGKSAKLTSEDSVHVTTDKKERLFKIIVIGELATGKTSFIKRYVHQFYTTQYRATIGVDFALKVLNWDDNTVIRLQLWDIAGQERFGNMTRVYYKDAVGCFIVFDVSQAKSFEAVIKWKNDLDTKVTLADGSKIPCVLLANKVDLPKEGPASDPIFLDRYCSENDFSGWFYTSPKDDLNVEEAAKYLISKILDKQKSITNYESSEDEVLILDSLNEETRNRCKVC